MTFTEFLDFLTPLPSSSATFILLIRKYAVFLDPLPLLFGRHIWKPPLSLSGVTLSRTTSSGNSVRNLPSSTFSSLPPNSGDALCCLPSILPFFPLIQKCQQHLFCSALLLRRYLVLSPLPLSFRWKPSVQCGIPTSLTFALLDSVSGHRR